jgi:hypothetical protein
MPIVRFRPTPCIVFAVGADCGGNVLQKAAPALITDENVELAIRPEADDAAVVIAATNNTAGRCAFIFLKRAQPNQIEIESE